MNNTDPFERLAIHDCLCNFQSAFDLLDWQLMEQCLWPELHVDYSSFRNDPPRLMTRSEYIALRKAALSELTMLHSFTNLFVTLNLDQASARCNYIILRFRTDVCTSDVDFFHSYGRYFFDLKKDEGEWRICGIKQQLVANYGNLELHPGFIKKNN